MSIFKAHIRQMGAYKPPLEQRDPHRHLLLDFNERTLPVSQMITQALVDYINSGSLQTYPCYGDICQRLADYCGVGAQEVMITNGSDQGIDLIIRASCQAGDQVIIPGPSFAMYSQCARVENLTIIEPAFTREQGFPTNEVIAAITDKTRLIVVSNPNNPTGTEVAREDIVKIAQAAPECTVLVDECYFEYTQSTVADAINQYPNLVITRTFSKTWGLPSLRFGYVLSRADNIDALLNIRGPYDVNQLALVAARAALEHPEYTQNYVKEVMTISKPLFEAWLNQHQIPYWPSSANYLWIFPDHTDAIYQRLLAAKILVRPKNDQHGGKGLRITLGTKAQTEQLIGVFAQGLNR